MTRDEIMAAIHRAVKNCKFHVLVNADLRREIVDEILKREQAKSALSGKDADDLLETFFPRPLKSMRDAALPGPGKR
jgi:peptidyl-tRNA hydrolase